MGKELNIIRLNQSMCKASADNNEVLFVRVGDVVTDTSAMIEVPETHHAIIMKGNGDMRYCERGLYPVFDDKTDKKQWKKGISVDIVYIAKDTQVLVRWGTPDRLRYRDAASGKVLTVGARGEFDVSVSNPEMFYRKVVGNKREFDIGAFRARFGGTVATEFTDIFLRIVEEKGLTYDRFSANKKQIGEAMGAILGKTFEAEWGLKVAHFQILDIDLLDEEMNAIEDVAEEQKRKAQRREELSEEERLDDKKWEREKYLRQLEMQDKAAYYDMLKAVGGKSPAAQKPLVCPDCRTPYSPGAKFCANCGRKLSDEPVVCPDCGHVNAAQAHFCANCGRKLIGG